MELARGSAPLLNRLLDTTKVVIVEGGRGVGKTTLAREVARERGFASVFDLSDPADRAALAGDSHRVLAASPKPIFVDEAQLEPELTVAVKRLVDSSPEPGQVLLTGSARIGRGALGGSDPLAGRAVRMRLPSFTQSELAGEPDNVVDRWWSGDLVETVGDELALDDLWRRVLVGGIPAVAIDAAGLGDDDDLRRRLLSTCVEGVLTMQLAGSRTDRARLLQTFRYLASNPGQILNISRAASELSMRAETVRGHLALAESAFLLDVAPALRPKAHQTVTAHPRVFAGDVALAAWAAETSVASLVRDVRLSGALLENFVAGEIAAQSAWTEAEAALLHWRDSRANKEVDLVLRRPDGRLLAVEVKSASTVSMADARGLTAFAEAAGDRLARSVIVHTGRLTTQLDDDVWAVPVSTFWSP